jgi:DNA-binding CsgD family transcriptional regulator
MARAAARGLVTLHGDCLPTADKLPLLPVAAALGELAGLRDGALLKAALRSTPPYVLEEVGRLLPRLGPASSADPGGAGEAWRRERLFSAVAELLEVVARRAPVGLVVEDVHWADTATLDFITYLMRASRENGVTVVATCRSDEAPLDGQVAGWLSHLRASSGVEEIRLGPLSRGEAADLVSALAGRPVPRHVIDGLYARTEGNPFFTEQLVAAALTDSSVGELRIPSGLPVRLAELLVTRAGRCAGEAQAVLTVLAVAGRPLSEDLLATMAGLNAAVARHALRQLASAGLLTEDPAVMAHRPRHALLAEAVAGALLAGERAALHGRIATVLQAAGGEEVAAEVAGHWHAAGRSAEELPARIAAAHAAERVFGYAQAAAHLQRALEMRQSIPELAGAGAIDLPRLHDQTIEMTMLSGDRQRARELAEEAYRLFADHPDPAIAARACYQRATWDAERTRFAGASDPGAWAASASAWQKLGCPHRAAYAWWRQAEVQLDSGQPATAAATALRAAAATAEGHAPLRAQIDGLAQRARITLREPPAADSPARRAADAADPYALTDRERAVLRLLVAGRSNAQIGAELFISPRTAGVHVTNILRKLGVSNRVQAASRAERAGLIDTPRA